MSNKYLHGFRTETLIEACALLVWVASFLTACVKLERGSLEKCYFTLEPVRAELPGPALVDGVLCVQRLRVSTGFSNRELIYKTGKSLLEADFYNLFFVPPSDMITYGLRNWLDRSRLFSYVVDPASLLQASWTLEGAVNLLYGDFTKSPPVAVVKLQAFLLDNSSPENAILFSRDYEEQAPLNDGSGGAGNGPPRVRTTRGCEEAKALITGYNRALEKIFSQLEADLRKRLERLVGDGSVSPKGKGAL
jgi:cholesterol transport system auxiliary component